MRTRLLALLAALALVLTAGFAVGCGDDDDDGGDGGGGGADLGTITEGELLVGTDTPYPPFEIGQPPDISGFDIEVMDAIAEDLGVEATYQDTGFDTIFRDTANGQFDTAAAASTITPERQQKVNFTDPYYEADAGAGGGGGQLRHRHHGRPRRQDRRRPGRHHGRDAGQRHTDASEVRGFPEGTDAITALATGQVEAVIVDLPVAADAVEKQGGVKVVEEIPLETPELFGFAVPKDNTALLDAMNQALVKIKDDGTLTELYQQYFKTDPPASVLEGTTEPAAG